MVSPCVKQCWIASGVFLNMMSAGIMLSYPYSLLPGLSAPDSPIKVDLHTGSSLASSVMSTVVVGIVLNSILMESIGRKRTFSLMLLPNFIGWIIIYFSKNMTTLIIGRSIGGIWLGSTHSLGCTILGEYTSPRYRGIFLALKTTSLCVGNLLLHVVSQYCTWRTVALLNVFLPIFVLCSAYLWPESPSWLATKRKFVKAEKAFYWLRHTSEESVKELEAMIQSQKVIQTDVGKITCIADKFMCFLRIFKTRKIFKPIFVMIFARLLLEATGRHVFPAFASDIVFAINGEKERKNFIVTLTVDLITIVSSVMSSILVKVLRRRLLLFFSGCASLLFLFSFCLYMFLVSQETVSSSSTIALALLVVYYFLANLGCCSIPSILLGEVFPLHRKGVALTVAEVLSCPSMLIFLKATPFMLVGLKIYGMFAINGLCMIFSLLYLYFSLPETRNRTLQEIENCFNDGQFVHVTTKNVGVNSTDNVNDDIDDDKDVKTEMLRETK